MNPARFPPADSRFVECIFGTACACVGWLSTRKEMPMTKMKLAAAGLLAVAMLAAPAMAQEATQEPGMMGFNYPNAAYLRGGYGHSMTPRPYDYYAGRANRQPGVP